MPEAARTEPPNRPPVSVIAPFVGSEAEARAAVAALEGLDRQPGDQLILADNSPSPSFAAKESTVELLWAGQRPSPYHARNEAAKRARNGWLLFVDSDCVLPRKLLDRFFDPPIGVETAVVAGEVVGLPEQQSLLARWARSRRGEFASHHQSIGPAPAGVAGNLLVRRDAWDAVGGFRPTPAADVELCWEVQARGLGFDYRPAARVLHRDPRNLRAVLGQARGYGTGLRWSRVAYGSSVPRARVLTPLVRALGGSVVWALATRFERAAFKAIDGAVTVATWWGYVTARPHPPATSAT